LESQPKKKNWYREAGLHILIWLLIFNMPLLSSNTDHRTFNEYLRSLIFPFSFAVVFYVNYLFLIQKFLYPKKLILFFIANLILYACCSFASENLRRFQKQQIAAEAGVPKKLPLHKGANGTTKDHKWPHPPSKAEIILLAFIAFAMTTGVSVAIRTTSQWFRSEDIRRELEREHLKSELLNLKNQLNPHFFFNTLNNIYGLIVQNQDKAQDAVHQLSKLMRYLLYDSNEKYVSLSKEVEFMNHYIDLMKLRLNAGVLVTTDFSTDTAGLKIAPLLFISLIENSFKHGVSLTRPSEIEMRMWIENHSRLNFEIRNTSFPKSDSDRSGSGIGLENLKKRLALLYPASHSLAINVNDKIYETRLTLQL
jgi:hypothetical protein